MIHRQVDPFKEFQKLQANFGEQVSSQKGIIELSKQIAEAQNYHHVDKLDWCPGLAASYGKVYHQPLKG